MEENNITIKKINEEIKKLKLDIIEKLDKLDELLEELNSLDDAEEF